MGKIGIIGSRRRDKATDYAILRETFLRIYQENDIIVSGGCPRGADNFAESIARDLGITIIIHNAKWTKYKNIAGHIRNQKIADDSDILIALVSKDRTGGTESTIQKYKKLGKRYLIVI